MKKHVLRKRLSELSGLGGLVQLHRKGTLGRVFHLGILGVYLAIVLPALLHSIAYVEAGVTNWIIGGFFVAVGGYLLWKISTWWNKALAVYEGGVVFAESDRLRVLKWTELAWITVRHEVSYTALGIFSYWKCTIGPLHGEPFWVNSGVCSSKILYEQITRLTFSIFWQRANESLSNDVWVDFGPIQIHRTDGLRIGEKRFAWHELEDVSIRNGRVRATPRRGKLFGEADVPGHRVKNYAVCLRLIAEMLRAVQDQNVVRTR